MSQRSASPAPSAPSNPPRPPDPDAPDALEPERVLRSRGLRVTQSRLAVLSALSQGAHLDAEAVAAGARALLGTLSTQAVYDALHAFTRAGVVRRIEPAGHPARYETRVGDNHHHLVCRSCGATADVDCVQGAAPCLEPATTYGFVIEEAEVTFWGICPSCTDRSIETVTTKEQP